MTDTERELIIKAQGGNVHAFEELIRKYDEKVLSLAYSMVGNYDDARDMYQDIFIKVYKAINQFRFKSSFYTWMYRIVVNQCINFRKKKKRKQLYSGPAGEDTYDIFERIESKTKNPEEETINNELSDMINTVVENLPQKQKMVFILRHVHGKKISEIAEIMKCTDGTIKNYLFRISEKLKVRLKEFRNG